MPAVRGFLVLLFALVFGLSTSIAAVAQDEDEEDNDEGDLIASINPGTCDVFDDAAAFEIGDLDAPDPDAGGNETIGVVPDPQVFSEDEEIEAAFDDLEDHVVGVIDLAAGEAVLACGEIGGVVHDGMLELPLYSVEDGSLRGIATFVEDDDEVGSVAQDEEETLTVTVYFVPGLEVAPTTPIATPIT